MLKLFSSKKKMTVSTDALPAFRGEPTLSHNAPKETVAPVLAMPKPRYAVAPTRALAKTNDEGDKILVEQEPSAPLPDTPALDQPVVTDIVVGSSDSDRTFVSALQSPEMNGPLEHSMLEASVMATASEESNAGHYTDATREKRNRSFDIDALRRQVLMIQSQHEMDRAEWERREKAHRLLEKQMMEELSLAHDRLLLAFAQRGQPFEEPLDHRRRPPWQRSHSAGMNEHRSDGDWHARAYRHPDSGYMEDGIDDDYIWQSQDLRMPLSSSSSSLVPQASRSGERRARSSASNKAGSRAGRSPGARHDPQDERLLPHPYPLQATSSGSTRRRQQGPGPAAQPVPLIHPSHHPYYYDH